MPRRRMIDPNIWKDPDFAKLNDAEKLLFIGIISNSDDEGRIIATPEALKADIFPYDHKKTARVVKNLRDSVTTKLKNVLLYQNSEVEYISLLRWNRYQKPKHRKESILPKPPVDPYPEKETSGETLGETSEETPSLPSSNTDNHHRLGQSSQVKDSIGKSSAVLEDFKKFIDNETDLTDFLTTTLTKYISAGAERLGDDPTPEQITSVRMHWGVPVLEKCWQDCLGEKMPTRIFDGARQALRDYPLEVVAKAFAKGIRYRGGKHQSWKYFEEIIKEEMAKKKVPK